MARTDGSSSWVALLRGVNVGGKNRIAMAELIELFQGAGGAGVRTHIQSGNVLFQAAPRLAARLSSAVQAAIEERLGLSVPVVLRSADELAAISRANPFSKARAPEDQLHVVFLRDEPQAGSASALDPRRSPPDEFVVVGREIYLRCPNGLGRTKLTNAWFDKSLSTVSTVRNWRTVLALRDLAQAASG